MKNRIFTKVLFLLTALFISSCEKEETIDFNQDVNVTIQGITYDHFDNTKLSDVTVTLVGDSPIVTQEDGVYRFGGQETGSHLLKFEKEGYATVVQTINIEGQDLVADEVTNSSIIELFQTDQSISTIFRISNGLETSPVANVPVTLELDALGSDVFFEDNIIQTTTDENGVLNLENLPNVNLNISGEIIIDSDLYSINFSTLPGDIDPIYVLNKTSLLDDFLLVDSNIIDDRGNVSLNFPAVSNIEFAFSDNIDSNFPDQQITLTKDSRLIGLETTITDNVLTLNPLGDALEPGVSYVVNVKVRAENGIQTYDETFTFTVEGNEALILEKVTSLRLDEVHSISRETEIMTNTSIVVIEFEKVEGARSYEIFGSYSGAVDEFVKLDVFDVSDDDFDGPNEDNALEYQVNLEGNGVREPALGFFNAGETFKIIVRAVAGDLIRNPPFDPNFTNLGAFSDPLEIELGDEN